MRGCAKVLFAPSFGVGVGDSPPEGTQGREDQTYRVLRYVANYLPEDGVITRDVVAPRLQTIPFWPQ